MTVTIEKFFRRQGRQGQSNYMASSSGGGITVGGRVFGDSSSLGAATFTVNGQQVDENYFMQIMRLEGKTLGAGNRHTLTNVPKVTLDQVSQQKADPFAKAWDLVKSYWNWRREAAKTEPLFDEIEEMARDRDRYPMSGSPFGITPKTNALSSKSLIRSNGLTTMIWTDASNKPDTGTIRRGSSWRGSASRSRQN